jgi:formate hydrogenlyase transcriptional activator
VQVLRIWILFKESTDQLFFVIYGWWIATITTRHQVPAVSGIDSSRRGFQVPLEGTPAGLAFTSGQPVLLDTLDLTRFTSDVSRQVYESGYRAGGGIPLIVKGHKLGVLAFACKRENAFSESDKELLCQVANQIAIAVDNALNFERALKAEQQAISQSERLGLLLEINNAVVSNLELQSLMKTIATCLAKVSHYDAVGLALYVIPKSINCAHTPIPPIRHLLTKDNRFPLKAPPPVWPSRRAVPSCSTGI